MIELLLLFFIVTVLIAVTRTLQLIFKLLRAKTIRFAEAVFYAIIPVFLALQFILVLLYFVTT